MWTAGPGNTRTGMMRDSLYTPGLFPGGQGKEDAGFGGSHGHRAGIPVLVLSGCIWTAQRNVMQEHQSQQQHGCAHMVRCSSCYTAWPWQRCSQIQRWLRHSHTRGSAPCWAWYWVRAMNHATSGFHGDILGLQQCICEQCLSPCFEKKGDNISMALTSVWVMYRWAHGLVAIDLQGELMKDSLVWGRQQNLHRFVESMADWFRKQKLST